MQDTGVIDGRDMTGNGPQMTGLVKLNAPACCYSLILSILCHYLPTS